MTANTPQGYWNIDANPEDADWTKKSWDLGGPAKIGYVLDNVIAPHGTTQAEKQDYLTRFMLTPAGRGMPEAHRVRLRKMGYDVIPA